MNRWMLLLFMGFCLAMTAAQCIDPYAGVKEVDVPVFDKDGKPIIDPETGKQLTKKEIVETPGAPASAAEGILGKIFPPLGAILGILRWGYIEVRKKKLDGSAKALVAGITNAVDKKGIAKEDIYPLLTEASNIYANRKFFSDFVMKVKNEVRAKNKEIAFSAPTPSDE